jgi:hypothetical protein
MFTSTTGGILELDQHFLALQQELPIPLHYLYPPHLPNSAAH